MSSLLCVFGLQEYLSRLEALLDLLLDWIQRDGLPTSNFALEKAFEARRLQGRYSAGVLQNKILQLLVAIQVPTLMSLG